MLSSQQISVLESYLAKIISLRIWKKGDFSRPHKLILIMCLMELIEKNNEHKNMFLFKELEPLFETDWGRHGTFVGLGTGLLEYPYYHLISDGFWHHKLKRGAEALYQEYQESKTPRYRFTKSRILETIEYAYLDDELYELLTHQEVRTIFKERLKSQIEILLKNENLDESAKSLFWHEKYAIDSIITEVKRYNLGKTVSNLLIYDNQTNDYYECDIIVIAPQGIYVVELKHWSGKIRIAPYKWVKDGVVYRRDPHAVNQFKAKILKGIYQHQFRTYPDIWIESVVVLTNPDAEVEGALSSKTDKHCPSFDSIDTFIDYLRYQKKTKAEKLENTKIERIGLYLESLQQAKKHKGYTFPGFEIVERLTERPDLIECVARPVDGRIRRLQRFRVFLPPQGGGEIEKSRFIARARNTLDAISRIGDYPNILRVWSVPDETGLIVEGSDWSDQGTLRDLLDGLEDTLQINEALDICKGLLDALTVVHGVDIIHRAIKPENILMVNGRPKLMNFDLSYQLDPGEHITVIPDSAALKRDPYTAPEVYSGGDVDERTDLFSIGVILFELLTRTLPFKISTELEATNGRMTEVALEKLKNQDIPTPIIGTIENLICLNRKQRIRDAASVWKMLGLREARPATDEEKRVIDQKLEPGEEYDVFTIEILLAESPISQVYLAKTVGNYPVILKVFNHDTPLARIQNEEKAASSVYSPYLIHAKRIGHWKKERFFLELNYVEGRLMRDDIKSSQKPDIDEFKSVTSCLLQAVYALHHRIVDGELTPLLHCDIKPDNIIVIRDGSAVLIDFGIAGLPRIDQYQGTAGYIAPDLIQGGDIKFSENGDLFALGVTLFEWFYGIHPYETLGENAKPVDARSIRDDVPLALNGWILKAIKTGAEERFQNIEEMQAEFQEAIQETEKTQEQVPSEDLEFVTEPEDLQISEPVILPFSQPEEVGNPFVAYLNSLHNVTGANENALAESQARSQNFCHIHVPLQITDRIFGHLIDPNGPHVILTGNAGDGKSTVDLELFKRFNGVPADQPLPSDMRVKEIVQHKDIVITLIKDMSELAEKDRRDLLKRACQNKGRYFIISNTGTLLNVFKGLADNRAEWLSLQNNLLRALASPIPIEINHGKGRFQIINITRTDSIDTACKVFDKMLAPERWGKCDVLDCRSQCPIYANVRMLCMNKQTMFRRIELFYRRLFEYGYRLTIRQMTEHLAYAITAGLDYNSIREMSQLALRPPLRRYLFFNRFFGDCGDKPDEVSDQINAVRFVRTLESGLKPNPGLDRMLWIEESSQSVSIADEELQGIYVYLRNAGRGIKSDEGLSASSARLQIRRLIYLYGTFKERELGKQFVSTFLDSPMLETYVGWQKKGKATSQMELRRLRRGIIHILQEHFTGLRLPETAGDQETIFITLNRRNYDIRQTAQVVLAKIPADDFELVLKPVDSEIGVVQHRLSLRKQGTDCGLDLDLPFLDYVHSRHQGEIAQQLQTFYVDRLERFKLALLEGIGNRRREDMMLVRLQLNHQFKSQSFSIHDGILEVTN